MLSIATANAQRYGDIDAIRLTALRLQHENDSLRFELAKYKVGFASSWDLLTGLEPDEEQMLPSVNPRREAFSDDLNREVLLEVRAACPSLGQFPFNDAIKKQIDVYTETRRKTMSFAVARYKSYLPIFHNTFRKYNVPEDIIALVIVESAVSPKAISPVGAAGMWQLMPETARLYGLRVDSYVDERFDPIASCDAAARYLKNAYARFGDWGLAIASYNCGPGRVNKVLGAIGKKATIWDVLDHLPAETKNYLPAFMAARYTLTYFDTLDIPLRTISRPNLYRVVLENDTTLSQLSAITSLDYEYIKSINPHIMGEVIPAGSCHVYLTKDGYNKLNIK